MIQRLLLICAALLAAAPAASAEGFFDLLKPKSQSAEKAKPADAASLLTLEPKQNEMYPRISPNGEQLLVTVSEGKKEHLSRRVTENGDPIATVLENEPMLATANWFDAGNISFLSERAGGLGLWTKPAEGQGVLRRLLQLHGELVQLVSLPDGGAVAVRLLPLSGTRKTATVSKDGFENWNYPEHRTAIVHIDPVGSERVLSDGINPAVSPDGKRIAFSMASGRSIHLWTMRIDGSELVQLTSERSIDVQPTWSRDGKRIIFTSNRANADMRNTNQSNWDIWSIGIDGKGLTQLTMDEARDGGATVAKDGTVYFHSDRRIGKESAEVHQVKSAPRGFHIWTIAQPKIK